MAILTFIARISDGMILVSSMENAGEYTNTNLDVYKHQAKQILKSLTPQSPSKCSIMDDASAAFHFHYLLGSGGVCYLTLCSKGYPKRLAFLYLDELQQAFEHYLAMQYEQWHHHIATIARPYAFIQFDKTIQAKRKEYIDPSSRENLSKLNANLNEIQNVMRQNIQQVLSRGERLDHVSKVSSNLADRSKEFKWGAKKLHLQAIYRKYGPLVLVGVLVLVSLVLYFGGWL